MALVAATSDEGLGAGLGAAGCSGVITYFVVLYGLTAAAIYITSVWHETPEFVIGCPTVCIGSVIFVWWFIRHQRSRRRAEAEHRRSEQEAATRACETAAKERTARAEAARRESEGRERHEHGQRYLKQLQQLLGHDHILLDTNIWMEPKCKAFIRMLAERRAQAGRRLRIIGPEYEEIARLCRAKSSAKSSQARWAKKLVDELLERNELEFEEVSVDPIPKAYFDAVCQLVSRKLRSQGDDVAIITDDGDLRIRLTAYETVPKQRREREAWGALSIYTSSDVAVSEDLLTDDAFIAGFENTPMPTLDQNMQMFTYDAMSHEGREIREAVVFARTSQEAIEVIRSKGMFPTKVRHAKRLETESHARPGAGAGDASCAPTSTSHEPSRGVTHIIPASAKYRVTVMNSTGRDQVVMVDAAGIDEAKQVVRSRGFIVLRVEKL